MNNKLSAEEIIMYIKQNNVKGAYGPGDQFSGEFYKKWVKKMHPKNIGQFGLVFKKDKLEMCLVNKKWMYVIQNKKIYYQVNVADHLSFLLNFRR